MASGYVLGDSYTNATFTELFRKCIEIDIYDNKYAFHGNSKAKRLRAFWELQIDVLVGKVLEEILDIWSYKNPEQNLEEKSRYLMVNKTVSHP